MADCLPKFVRDACSKFDRHYQTCMDDEPCKVLAGKRCGYFEQVVLCSPDYKYRLPNYDYAKLFGEYAETTKTEAPVVSQRLCDCGNPLTWRRKSCDACARERRRGRKGEKKLTAA